MAVVLTVLASRVPGPDVEGRRRWWRAVRRGALALVVGLVALGVASFVAFDALFEVFHRLVFPGGSYTFVPTTERLVQLFPFRFWQETAIAVGAVAIVLGIALERVTAGRSRPGPPA